MREDPRLAMSPDWQVPAFTVQEFAPRRTRYCVGIPVINEGDRIQTQLRRMQALELPELADLMIADGGSRDGSLEPEFLRSMGVRTLLTKTGTGKLSAQLRMFFAYGLSQGYEGFVLIGGNNKDSVESIPDFLAALEQGWDYIQGSRYMPGGLEKNTPLSRYLAVRLIHAPLLSLASGFHYTDTTNGFRAVSRPLLLDDRLQPFRDVFDTYNLHYYLSVMAPRLGYRVQEIPVIRLYPKHDPTPSKIQGWRANWHILVVVFKTALGAYQPSPRKS